MELLQQVLEFLAAQSLQTLAQWGAGVILCIVLIAIIGHRIAERRRPQRSPYVVLEREEQVPDKGTVADNP